MTKSPAPHYEGHGRISFKLPTLEARGYSCREKIAVERWLWEMRQHCLSYREQLMHLHSDGDTGWIAKQQEDVQKRISVIDWLVSIADRQRS